MTAATPLPTLYKVLGPDRMPYHGGAGPWAEPGTGGIVSGRLVPCENGLHIVTEDQLLQWLGPCVWKVETRGRLLNDSDKYVAREARLVHQYVAWNERAMRLFAADCAEHVLPLFERERPGDLRPRQAIAAARQFASGEIDAAARQTTWSAASDAAWQTTWSAAGDVASAAASAVSGATAWSAARYAARSATSAVAWSAARYAARSAAWSAASAATSAAVDAERGWQTDLLLRYLRGEVGQR